MATIQLECPKCHSHNITVSTNTYTKSKSRSLLWNVLMTVITGGIWLIWMLIRKRKEKVIHEKTAICQSCGYSWNIK